jgi:predicted nucleotidyltransferase
MNAIITENIDLITKYCKKYKVKELYAVGSVVSDNFSDNSDVDLLIDFEDISIAEYTDNYFTLHDIFSNIFKRKIDLITKKSLQNPFFIEAINNSKVLLYAG